MSINLLFSNPGTPFTPINTNTWNAIAGPGSTIAVAGTMDQIDASNNGGTTTLSFPQSVIFPDAVTIPSLNINNVYTMPDTLGTPQQVLTVPASGSVLEWTTNGGGTGDITDVSGTANQITVTNGAGPIPILSFPTGTNNFQIPGNLITCAGAGASQSIAIGPNALGATPASVSSDNIGIGENTGLLLTSGANNILLGANAGSTTTTSSNNICLGINALDQATPTTGGNICIGTSTGATIGNNNDNVCIGINTDIPNVGYDGQININNLVKLNAGGNVAIGYANHNNISASSRGSFVVSVGDNCMTNIIENLNNNMVGVGSYNGNLLTTGNYNTLIGNQNLSFPNNITSNNNVVVGNYVGQDIANGNNNIILGNLTCNGDSSNNSTCVNNIVIGNNAGNTNFNTTSNNNVLIGNSVDCSTNGQSNYLCIKTDVPVLYGTSSQLQVPNFNNIWNVDPILNGSILSCDTSGALSWISSVPPVQTSFNFLFVDNGAGPNVIDFGTTTLYNVGGIITGIFPFDALLTNSKQYYVPGVSNLTFTCNTFLPVGYRPSRDVVYQITVSEVTLDVNQDPDAVTQIFPMQLTISASGIMNLNLYTLSSTTFTYVQAPFVGGTAYMFNTYSNFQSNAFVFQML